MGNEQSQPVEGSSGFHVLKVKDQSPAYRAGIQPLVDFVLSINEIRLDKPGSELTDLLKANIGRKVKMTIYSSKEQKIREVELIPSDRWSASNKDGLMGCTLRFCTYVTANENVWHILDVIPDSPAANAGLQPHSDYVISTPHQHIESQADFQQLIEEHQGVPVQLLVYNRYWDTCREVAIVPDKNWGGQGSLGCSIGYGAYIIVTCTEYLSETTKKKKTPYSSPRPERGSTSKTRKATRASSYSRQTYYSTTSPTATLSSYKWDPKRGPRRSLPWEDGTPQPPLEISLVKHSSRRRVVSAPPVNSTASATGVLQPGMLASLSPSVSTRVIDRTPNMSIAALQFRRPEFLRVLARVHVC